MTSPLKPHCPSFQETKVLNVKAYQMKSRVGLWENRWKKYSSVFQCLMNLAVGIRMPHSTQNKQASHLRKRWCPMHPLSLQSNRGRREIWGEVSTGCRHFSPRADVLNHPWVEEAWHEQECREASLTLFMFAPGGRAAMFPNSSISCNPTPL